MVVAALATWVDQFLLRRTKGDASKGDIVYVGRTPPPPTLRLLCEAARVSSKKFCLSLHESMAVDNPRFKLRIYVLSPFLAGWSSRRPGKRADGGTSLVAWLVHEKLPRHRTGSTNSAAASLDQLNAQVAFLLVSALMHRWSSSSTVGG